MMHPSLRQKVTFLSTLSVIQPHHQINTASVILDQTPSTLKTETVCFPAITVPPANIKPTVWKTHTLKKCKLIIIFVSNQNMLLDWVWNVMAHAQKPDFVFLRNGRVHLNRRGRQFIRLLAAEACGSAVVMLDTPRSGVAWEYWLPTPLASFPFTSPPVRHLVPSSFNWTPMHAHWLGYRISPDKWEFKVHVS
jgi:hypothetical protein